MCETVKVFFEILKYLKDIFLDNKIQIQNWFNILNILNILAILIVIYIYVLNPLNIQNYVTF